MPQVLRTTNDQTNPTLAGAVYGRFITIGRPYYYRYDGVQTRFIIFLCDGGKYGIDSLSVAEYKSVPLAEYVLHRGTFTKQIEPFEIDIVDTSGNSFKTVELHPFAADDEVRFAVKDGNIAPPISSETKYFVLASGLTASDFKVSLTSGGSPVDLTGDTTGTMLVWKADTGFDDPEQGLPVYCPETENCFTNIAYVEGKLPEAQSSSDEPPDWLDFRFVGIGRRLMDYDADGDELGVIEGDTDEGEAFLCSVPPMVLDTAITDYRIEKARFDFPSWVEMRDDALVKILQRIRTDETGIVNGLTGTYYSDLTYTNSVVSRIDPVVDFNFGTDPPAGGMPNVNYSIRWIGRIKPRYSELYTLTFDVDDNAIVFINGQFILDTNVIGVNTVEYTFVADQLYDIQIDFLQIVAGAHIYFKWQSASQALEIVPASRMFPNDEIVDRYGGVGMASPTPTECAEYFERLMERIPGWDWTDDDGLIKFLPPDREVVYEFRFDLVDDDSPANFEKLTFQKQKRRLADRDNFLLGMFRNVLLTGYPVSWAQGDRENLRNLANGTPTNKQAVELGVATLSLAERVLEMKLVETSDPDHIFSANGDRRSSIIRKNHFVQITYYDLDGNYVADEKCRVTLHGWGEKNGRNKFTLLPVPEVFYTDEPATEEEYEGERET